MATKTVVAKVNGIELDVLHDLVSAVQKEPDLAKCKFRARNTWQGGAQNRTTVQDFFAAKQDNPHKQAYAMDADEPPMLAGNDDAPNPVEHLLHALASCVTTSLVAHAAVRGISLEEVSSELLGDIDLRGFLGISPNVPKGYTNIQVKFKVKCADEDLGKLMALAQFSPVFNTISQGAKVDICIESA